MYTDRSSSLHLIEFMIRRLSSFSYLPLIPLLFIIILFVAFQYQPPIPIQDPVAIGVQSNSLWELYFSRPQDPSARTFRGGPEQALVEAIDNARFSVHMAIYHLNLWSVRDALIRAHSRGVEVRIVTESSFVAEREIRQLANAGIEVHEDRRPPLMHHKFVVVDRLEVWTGSMNLTINGAYKNDNNLIRISSSVLAKNYEQEFEEMFSEDRFGGLSLADTLQPILQLGNITVENYFSPDDGVEAQILKLLDGAQKKVDFLAFTFTSDALTTSLIQLHQRGIRVRGIVEASQINASGADFQTMLEAGLDVRPDGNPNKMHHKVIVIDDRTVILGSYNFTRSAEEKNDENVLVVHDPSLAALFLLEFDRLYQLAAH